jgi:ADP-ribosylglycohydrolase
VGEVGAKGWMSVRAAVTAFVRNDSLRAMLRDCVDFGGDVDTVATIALAAGSCSRDVAQDLPSHLIEGLENGPYGRDYLAALEARLRARLRT